MSSWSWSAAPFPIRTGREPRQPSKWSSVSSTRSELPSMRYGCRPWGPDGNDAVPIGDLPALSRRSPGTRRPAQPLRVGLGVIYAQFDPIRQGVGKHERGGGIEFAAQQACGTGRLKTQGPPGLPTHVGLGEFHRTPWFPAGPRNARRAGLWKPADPAPLAYPPPASKIGALGVGRAMWKRPLLPGLHATAGTPGHLQKPGAAALHLYLQRPRLAHFHRKLGQVRIEQVDVLQHPR